MGSIRPMCVGRSVGVLSRKLLGACRRSRRGAVEDDRSCDLAFRSRICASELRDLDKMASRAKSEAEAQEGVEFTTLCVGFEAQSSLHFLKYSLPDSTGKPSRTLISNPPVQQAHRNDPYPDMLILNPRIPNHPISTSLYATSARTVFLELL